MDATGGHVPRLWLRSASTAVRTLSTDVGAAAAPDARWRRSAVSPRTARTRGLFSFSDCHPGQCRATCGRMSIHFTEYSAGLAGATRP